MAIVWEDPSIEVWTYKTGQDPNNLLYMPETNYSNLGSLNQQIPDVSNDPSTASVVVNGSDFSDVGGDLGLTLIGSDPSLILGGGGGGGGGNLGDMMIMMDY